MRPEGSQPVVSVIVAVFDVRPYLGQCLATVLAQSWSALEVIVVDDGGTDGGGALADAFARKDPRVRVIRQPNAGLSAARNTGMAAARGEWLCFVDGDDYLSGDLVERLLTHAQAEGVGLAACGLYLDQGGALTAHPGVHQARGGEGPVEPRLLDGCSAEALRLYPSAWNKIYRRDLVEGLSFPEGLQYEDHPFFLACLRRAGRLVHTPEPLYFYRRGRRGQITDRADEAVFDVFAIVDQIRQERARFLEGAADRSELERGFDAYVYRLLWERVITLRDSPLLASFVEVAKTVCAPELAAIERDPEARDAFIPGHGMDLFAERLTVSVLIPAGPEASVTDVTRAISAAAGQTVRTIEIVVALQGVTGRAALLAALADSEPRLRLLTVEPGRLGTARNALLQAARGRFVTFLEIGDDLYPDSLETLLWAAEAGAAGIAAGAVVYRTRGGEPERYHSGLHAPVAGDVWPMRDPLRAAGDLWATPCAKLIAAETAKTLAFDEAGFFDEHAFHVALALTGQDIAYTPSPVYRIGEHPGGRAIWSGGAAAADAGRAIDAVAAVIGERMDDPSWRGLFVRLAYRLAWERLRFADFREGEKPAAEAAVRAAAALWGVTQAECLACRDGYTDDAALHLFVDTAAESAG